MFAAAFDTTTFEVSDEVAVRLLAALVLGALVGAEREATDQPAGLRTHIAVCLGAALFGVVSTLGFTEFAARRASTNFQVDVTRVASQVVVGIGFLGAGMIFRQGTAVRNLTTAASLWVVAAIGLAAGVGDIGTAGVTTADPAGEPRHPAPDPEPACAAGCPTRSARCALGCATAATPRTSRVRSTASASAST